jgi:acetyl esterase/lipase
MEKRTISVRANIMYNTLKKYSIKKIVFKTVLNKPQKFKNKKVLDKINRKLQTKEINIEGFRVITVSTSNPSNKHIIFFHGGGYVAEAMKGQIVIMEKLVELYNFKVTFIDYPLAPEYTAVTTHKISAAAYSKIREDYPDDIFFFLGDSAGGGLALAFLQTLRDSSSIYMPTKTVLLSPWLEMSHPTSLFDLYY